MEINNHFRRIAISLYPLIHAVNPSTHSIAKLTNQNEKKTKTKSCSIEFLLKIEENKIWCNFSVNLSAFSDKHVKTMLNDILT